jgi:hypothetical protein
MLINIDIWQVVGMLGACVAFAFGAMMGAGKLLLKQFEKRLDERFSAQEISRSETKKHWDEKFSMLENAAATEAKEWQRIERDILIMKADMPVLYVRKEDYVRNQSIIEAKIDGLAIRIENALLKGERYG